MIPRHLARAITRLHQDPDHEVVRRLNMRYPHYHWRAGHAAGYTPGFTVRHGCEWIDYCYKTKTQN